MKGGSIKKNKRNGKSIVLSFFFHPLRSAGGELRAAALLRPDLIRPVSQTPAETHARTQQRGVGRRQGGRDPGRQGRSEERGGEGCGLLG